MSEEQTPVEQVPPASRLGEIVGWSLLALALVCFVAFIISARQVYVAWEAVQHAQDVWFHANLDHGEAAYATYMAANAAYSEMALRMFLSLDASIVFLLLSPGLLYAMRPSLVGGPAGRLFRPSSERLARERLAQRLPLRRHPVTFYQGIGLVLASIATISISPIVMVPILAPTMSWLMVLAMLLYIACYFVILPLIVQATWWYTRRRDAERGQKRPQA